MKKGHTNEARRATTSKGLNPASLKRFKTASAESDGLAIRVGSAAIVALGRPRRNCKRGAPGQLPMPTAAASWILQEGTIQNCMAGEWTKTHISPAETSTPVFLERNCERTFSSD